MSLLTVAEVSGEDRTELQNGRASFSRQTLVTLFAQALTFASGILVTPLVFKFSGARTYGAYVLIMSVAGLLSGVLSLGIGFGAKRYLPSADTPTERAALFYPQFWANQIVTLSVVAILFAVWLGTTRWTGIAVFEVFFVCAFLLLQGLQSQGGDYLRATHRIVAFNIAMTAQPLIYVLIVFFSFWQWREIGLQTLLIAQLVSIATMVIFCYVKIISEAGVRLGLPTVSSLRSDILLGGPLVLSYIVDTVLAFSDRYIIGLVLTVEDVAYYAAAYTLASVPLFLVKAITIVLLPRLSRLLDLDQKAEATHLVAQTIRIFLLLALPFLAGVVVVGCDVLTLYTTPAAAEEARYALPLIAAGTIFYGLFLIYTTVSSVLLNTRQILKANLVAMVMNVGLNIVLLRFIPDIAVAAATTLLSYLLILYSITRGLEGEWLSAFKISYLIRLAGASMAMAMVIFVAMTIWTAPQGDPLQTILLILAGLVLYPIFVLLSGALSKTEISQLRRAFLKSGA